MAALTKMTAVEAKLFLRDPGAPITVIGIPVALLLVFGLMPDASKPSNDFGGHSPLASVIAPMAVTILLAMLALTLFPTAMATYREKGVLKRLSASPVPPNMSALREPAAVAGIARPATSSLNSAVYSPS